MECTRSLAGFAKLITHKLQNTH